MTDEPKKAAMGIDVLLSLNTKKTQRQLTVIRDGIDAILTGLEKINKGCPDCGNDLAVYGKIEFLENDDMKVVCSECGCVYIYKKQ